MTVRPTQCEKLDARSFPVCDGEERGLSFTRKKKVTGWCSGREEVVVVTQNGRPAAVLINVDEYASVKETLDAKIA